MSMMLYAHPFSSYCQKVLIALYESGTPFELRMIGPGEDRTTAEFAALWPLQRMPVLVEGGRTVVEASIIIEHLGLHHPGPVQWIPDDPRAALAVRMMDRFFDNYVMTPMQKIVADQIRAAENRDRQGVAEAPQLLDTAYRWLDEQMKEREWSAGESFSLSARAAATAPCEDPMADPVDALILDLLEWIGPGPRADSEVIDAWRTSRPRLPVWEEANERGFIERSTQPGFETQVSVTALGWDHRKAQRPDRSATR
jgi:glutathione S-transferase